MIINPDEHEQRQSNPSEAFASAARMLRDRALKDPDIREVWVMVGPAGCGKSTWAKKHDRKSVAIVDGCHVTAAARRSLVGRIRKANKVPIAIYIPTTLRDCLARNMRRDRRVPPSVIRKQHKDLSRRGPRKVEGWHEVRTIEE